MIIEETNFRSLLSISALPIPTTIHRYKGVYFALAHIGESLYLAFCKDAPQEETPFIEYDLITRDFSLTLSSKDFSKSPTSVIIPVIEVTRLTGETGEKIKEALGV